MYRELDVPVAFVVWAVASAVFAIVIVAGTIAFFVQSYISYINSGCY